MTDFHVFVPSAPDGVVRIQCRCGECMTYPPHKGSGHWNEDGCRWELVNNKWRRG